MKFQQKRAQRSASIKLQPQVSTNKPSKEALKRVKSTGDQLKPAAPWWSDVVLIIPENTIMGACMSASAATAKHASSGCGTPFFPFMRCCRDFSSGEFVRFVVGLVSGFAYPAVGCRFILGTKARQARLISTSSELWHLENLSKNKKSSNGSRLFWRNLCQKETTKR